MTVYNPYRRKGPTFTQEHLEERPKLLDEYLRVNGVTECPPVPTDQLGYISSTQRHWPKHYGIDMLTECPNETYCGNGHLKTGLTPKGLVNYYYSEKKKGWICRACRTEQTRRVRRRKNGR